MRPMRVDRELVAEQAHAAMGIGSTNEDGASLPWQRGRHLPARWKGLACRRRFNACGTLSPICGYVALRTHAQAGHVGMLEAAPDLCLPAAIVGFDCGLEAGLARWSEYGRDVQSQAQSDYRADRVAVLMRALKARVVIKLGKCRQAYRLPVLDQLLAHRAGSEGATHERSHQAAVKPDGIEDFHRLSATDHQAFDEVELIEFGLPCSNCGKIPSQWRCRPTHSALAVKHAATRQDAINSGTRGLGLAMPGPSSQDGISTVFAQRTALSQPLTQAQHTLLDPRIHPIHCFSSSGQQIAEIASCQGPTPAARHPALNSKQAHAKFTCDCAHRKPCTNPRHHCTSFLNDGAFLLMNTPLLNQTASSYRLASAEPRVTCEW